MGQKQLQRWHLVKLVQGRKITLREAGEKMGVSYRHAKRIWRAIRERGIKGLVHGNRGQPSKRRIGDVSREKILACLGGQVYFVCILLKNGIENAGASSA
jgi:transposase